MPPVRSGWNPVFRPKVRPCKNIGAVSVSMYDRCIPLRFNRQPFRRRGRWLFRKATPGVVLPQESLPNHACCPHSGQGWETQR
jgi:hypothetical protein